jgi:hypothetical protein
MRKLPAEAPTLTRSKESILRANRSLRPEAQYEMEFEKAPKRLPAL